MTERRHFTRLDLDITAEIEEEKIIYRAQVCDLSLKGVLLRCDDFTGKLGQSYNIHIPLSGEILLSFKALLVHQHNNEFGFKFESQSLDSLSHLRSLLEFNSDDPNTITDELFFLRQ